MYEQKLALARPGPRAYFNVETTRDVFSRSLPMQVWFLGDVHDGPTMECVVAGEQVVYHLPTRCSRTMCLVIPLSSRLRYVDVHVV